MARTTGPLFSLTASGSLGKTIVYSIWKGRSYVRSLVIPQNNRTALQQLTRGFLGAIAKSAKAVLTASKDTAPGLGSQFFLDTATYVPGTQSWVATYQKDEHSSVASDQIIFDALGTEDELYETAAGTAGLSDYVSVGDTPVTYTKGFQLYMLAKFAVGSLAYTGFAAGIDEATELELTAFVGYVQTSV